MVRQYGSPWNSSLSSKTQNQATRRPYRPAHTTALDSIRSVSPFIAVMPETLKESTKCRAPMSSIWQQVQFKQSLLYPFPVEPLESLKPPSHLRLTERPTLLLKRWVAGIAALVAAEELCLESGAPGACPSSRANFTATRAPTFSINIHTHIHAYYACIHT